MSEETKVAVTVRKVPKYRKRLMVRLGRGRLGGTTYLDAVAQMARKAGRAVILVDADTRNPSLSRLYPEARVPEGATPGHFADLMTAVLGELYEHQGPISALVDIGGGQDRSMVDYILDLNLAAFCQEAEVMAVAAYMLGPDEDDLAHALSVRDAKLMPGAAELLVMSEAAAKGSQSPEAAFASMWTNPQFAAWMRAGALPVPVRRLACLDKIRGLGLSLNDAMTGKPGEGGKPLGPVERFQIKDWLRVFEARHADADALDLLP